MKFKGIIQLHGKTATGIEVPPEVVIQLGAGKKPPVKVTLNNYTYRTSVAVMGGQYLISLSAENRKAAQVSAGDEVDVTIILDTEPRVVVVPADLKKLLEQDPVAQRFYESLSYSHQQKHVLALEQAKTAETRQRRLLQTMEKLRQQQS